MREESDRDREADRHLRMRIARAFSLSRAAIGARRAVRERGMNRALVRARSGARMLAVRRARCAREGVTIDVESALGLVGVRARGTRDEL